jgi:hypothetical protein
MCTWRNCERLEFFCNATGRELWQYMIEDPKPMCLKEQGVGSFSNIIEGFPHMLERARSFWH